MPITTRRDPETATIFALLATVCDPEIPVINVLELGIVRDVIRSENGVRVCITPTYSGCPAIEQIESDIYDILKKNGLPGVTVKTVLNPPWTTDMMWISAKEKLKRYGIAPPCMLSRSNTGEISTPPCPLCDSTHTTLINSFSSTACKALYKCDTCKEPFDYFKTH